LNFKTPLYLISSVIKQPFSTFTWLLISFSALWLACIGLLIIMKLSWYLIGFIFFSCISIQALLMYRFLREQNRRFDSISNLIAALLQQDYSLRGHDSKQIHYNELLSLINQLADTLQQHHRHAIESQQLSEQIMAQMDAALIALNKNGSVIFQNQAAVSLLKLDLDSVALNRALIAQLHALPYGQNNTLQLDNQPQPVLVFRERFIQAGQQHDLFLFKELGSILLEQQNQAWQKLVRVISHELNNSLTPIGTISRSLIRQLEQGKPALMMKEGLAVIKERSEYLASFTRSYSEMAKLPPPDKKPLLMALYLQGICQLFNQQKITLSCADDLTGFIDSNQCQQVLINLIKNAVEANQSANRQDLGIEIICQLHDKNLQISIYDHGLGIDNPDNLFVPFYSTKPHGSGIGLMLSRQIITNHFGRLSIDNGPSGGAVATITLPSQ